MKLNHKSTLRLAVAGCFGLIASQAGAQVVLGTNSIPFAAELVPTATITNATGFLDVRVASIPSLVPTTANPMFIKIALLGGATFAAAPTMTCAITGAGAVRTAGDTTAGDITIGGAGSNQVTFRITAGNGVTALAAGASGVCWVSGGTYNISGTTTKTISAQVEYTNGLTPTTTAQTGTFITFVRGLATTVSAPATNVVVDATSGSDNWAVGSNLTIGTAYIGKIVFGVAGVSALASAGAANIENSDAVSGAGSSITISGPAIAAALAIGSSGAYLSNVVGCTDTTPAAVFSASGSNSVTFTAAGLTSASLSAGVFACLRNPGNVVISTGQLTASVTPAPSGATTRVLDGSAPVSSNLANVGSNGVTRNAYVVNASTSTSKTSIVRLINRSSLSGVVTMTCYDEAGVRLGNANSSFGTVASNQISTMTSAQIETACGFTPSSGTIKYSVVFSGAMSTLEVLNFARDITTGTITLANTSTTDTK